ncbi:hypothetical protein GN956_G19835 [Arapaima gigas]
MSTAPKHFASLNGVLGVTIESLSLENNGLQVVLPQSKTTDPQQGHSETLAAWNSKNKDKDLLDKPLTDANPACARCAARPQATSSTWS